MISRLRREVIKTSGMMEAQSDLSYQFIGLEENYFAIECTLSIKISRKPTKSVDFQLEGYEFSPTFKLYPE